MCGIFAGSGTIRTGVNKMVIVCRGMYGEIS
jgi:hypothetical protein